LNEDTITVNIKYKDVEQTFIGNLDDVWISVNRFFSQIIPSFELAQRLMLTIDLQKLIEDFKDIITVAPEGPELLISKQKISDSETLGFYLIAAYMGHKLGLLSEETVSKDELQTRLGKSSKTTSARLSELYSERLVTRDNEGNYKITTIGIKHFQEDVLPKIRAKIQT